MRVIASYCELAALNLHMLTYFYVGLQKIKVSDGFRKFQMVSEGVGFQVSGFKFQEEKNKTLKTKTTFLKTIAITMSKGSGWKPALSVTGDEVSG